MSIDDASHKRDTSYYSTCNNSAVHMMLDSVKVYSLVTAPTSQVKFNNSYVC